MAGAKDIRRRIKSIGNTKKITKAMEMISAVKMRKSVLSTAAIRPYAHASLLVFANLASRLDKEEHELLSERGVGPELMIVITGNRGLCGSFNSQVLKKAYERARGEIPMAFISIGKKGESALRNRGFNIVASFNDLSYIPTAEEVRPIAKLARDEFLAGTYGKVSILYTDYRSAISSVPRERPLLPVRKDELEAVVREMNLLDGEPPAPHAAPVKYLIEPTPKSVLDFVIPRILEMQIYHALLESKASEESARMMAMKNATDAAGDMIAGLNQSYNKARQAKITQEISEISAGRIALEG